MLALFRTKFTSQIQLHSSQAEAHMLGVLMSNTSTSKTWLWTGRILSGLTSLMFLSSLPMVIFARNKIDEGMNKYGYSHTAGTAIICAEFLIGLLTAIPQT